MQTNIGTYDASTRTVQVTFIGEDRIGAEVKQDRLVPACFDGTGAYDDAATQTRIAQVGAGVAVKMLVGAITNPPSALDAPSEEETGSAAD